MQTRKYHHALIMFTTAAAAITKCQGRVILELHGFVVFYIKKKFFFVFKHFNLIYKLRTHTRCNKVREVEKKNYREGES